MKKLTLLVVAGAGYVLGSRAGRERYEQIKSQATKTWNNPKVQDAADAAQHQAKQTGADLTSMVGSKVAEAAGDVKDKVAAKVSSKGADHDGSEQPSTISPGVGTA